MFQRKKKKKKINKKSVLWEHNTGMMELYWKEEKEKF